MDETIVTNTSPLISLERMGILDLVPRLPYRFVAPQEVLEELQAGEKKGYGALAPDWLTFCKLSHPVPHLNASILGKGEAAAIALALEIRAERVCIDEWKGRRAALAAGLKVVGALGILGRAKKLGLVENIRPYIEQAIEAGIHYDADLIERVLHAVGER